VQELARFCTFYFAVGALFQYRICWRVLKIFCVFFLIQKGNSVAYSIMMKIGLSCALIVSAILLQCCGRLNEKFGQLHPAFTRVSFQKNHSTLESMTTANAGVNIYITSQLDGTEWVLSYANEDEANVGGITLPNGSYSVYSFGIDSWGNGYPRCGSSGTISLQGTAVTVPITLSNPTCNLTANSVFGPAADSTTGNYFNQLVLKFCSGGTASVGCTPNSVTGSMVAYVAAGIFRSDGSYQFDKAHSMMNGCTQNISASSTAFFNVFPPIGSATLPVPMAIDFFTSSDCSGSPALTRVWPKGLLSYENASGDTTSMNMSGNSLNLWVPY